MLVGYSPAVSVQCEEIRTESRWQRRMILTGVLGDSLRVYVRACVLRACLCVFNSGLAVWLCGLNSLKSIPLSLSACAVSNFRVYV